MENVLKEETILNTHAYTNNIHTHTRMYEFGLYY